MLRQKDEGQDGSVVKALAVQTGRQVFRPPGPCKRWVGITGIPGTSELDSSHIAELWA